MQGDGGEQEGERRRARRETRRGAQRDEGTQAARFGQRLEAVTVAVATHVAGHLPPPPRELDDAQRHHRDGGRERQSAKETVRTEGVLDGEGKATHDEDHGRVRHGHSRAEEEGVTGPRAAAY